MAIPADRNFTYEKAENKYKSLCTKDKRMLNMKCMVIPVVLGATGVVTESLKENLEPYQENSQQIRHKTSCTRDVTHGTRGLRGGDRSWFKRRTGRKGLRQETAAT